MFVQVCVIFLIVEEKRREEKRREEKRRQ